MCSPLNVCKLCCQAQSLHCNYFFLPLYSSETVNLARPFARRAANTRRPFFVAILSRKPCLFFLFLLEGWNVLFIVFLYFILFYIRFLDFSLYSLQNYSFFSYWQSFYDVFLLFYLFLTAVVFGGCSLPAGCCWCGCCVCASSNVL